MREIKSGDIILRIRASSLALFFYKQEFKADLFKDVSNMFKDWMSSPEIMEHVKGEMELKEDSAAEMFDMLPNGVELLQITWALNKAQNQAENLQTLPFEKWIEKYSDILIMDIFTDVLEEALQGFFRVNDKKGPPVG